MKHKLKYLFKNDIVLVISISLAILTSFLNPPTLEYLSYIDWHVLSILLSLMIIIAGFQYSGILDFISNSLIQKTKKVWQLILVLVLLCYFMSMLITNDVGLITFVPLSLLMLKRINRKDLVIPTVVLQTIAANLGSMLTPIGNPQNIYLYNLSHKSITSFVTLMLPYAGVSLILLLVSISKIKGTQDDITIISNQHKKLNLPLTLIFSALFVLSLLVVLHILNAYFVLAFVLITSAIVKRELINKADYMLLLTFIGLFIFIGNLKSINSFQHLLTQLVGNHEIVVSVFASQVISNVPAALLLSEFSTNLNNLIIGVNIGGLGTMIASMASLISYKFVAREFSELMVDYLRKFSILNILYLCILIVAAFLLT